MTSVEVAGLSNEMLRHARASYKQSRAALLAAFRKAKSSEHGQPPRPEQTQSWPFSTYDWPWVKDPSPLRWDFDIVPHALAHSRFATYVSYVYVNCDPIERHRLDQNLIPQLPRMLATDLEFGDAILLLATTVLKHAGPSGRDILAIAMSGDLDSLVAARNGSSIVKQLLSSPSDSSPPFESLSLSPKVRSFLMGELCTQLPKLLASDKGSSFLWLILRLDGFPMHLLFEAWKERFLSILQDGERAQMRYELWQTMRPGLSEGQKTAIFDAMKSRLTFLVKSVEGAQMMATMAVERGGGQESLRAFMVEHLRRALGDPAASGPAAFYERQFIIPAILRYDTEGRAPLCDALTTFLRSPRSDLLLNEDDALDTVLAMVEVCPTKTFPALSAAADAFFRRVERDPTRPFEDRVRWALSVRRTTITQRVALPIAIKVSRQSQPASISTLATEAATSSFDKTFGELASESADVAFLRRRLEWLSSSAKTESAPDVVPHPSLSQPDATAAAQGFRQALEALSQEDPDTEFLRSRLDGIPLTGSADIRINLDVGHAMQQGSQHRRTQALPSTSTKLKRRAEQMQQDDETEVPPGFKCPRPDCDRAYHSSRALYQHVRDRHKEMQVYPCPKEGCIKLYFSKFGLEYHIKHGKCEVEVNQEVFPCPKPGCAKVYESATSLRRHQREGPCPAQPGWSEVKRRLAAGR
ncbi:hypothetical protein OC842_006770 [Tilletia horrida]|uniref:C2H2-type domain-containing protein n=1 Tax=Tilletia horrida TaxID=155126 RepID=A0AAN6JN30_9BASI|nr:hypothetical protein OC842_006770 [Tilletia horrida]